MGDREDETLARRWRFGEYTLNILSAGYFLGMCVGTKIKNKKKKKKKKKKKTTTLDFTFKT